MCTRMYNDVRADVHPCARGCTWELGWGNSFLLPSLRVQIRFCFIHAGQACSRHVARLGANKVPFAKEILFIVVPTKLVLLHQAGLQYGLGASSSGPHTSHMIFSGHFPFARKIYMDVFPKKNGISWSLALTKSSSEVL